MNGSLYCTDDGDIAPFHRTRGGDHHTFITLLMMVI